MQYRLPDVWEQRPAGLRESYLDVDGARLVIATLDARTPTSRGIVLFVPGFTAGHEDFYELLTLTADRGYTAVSFSQRGQGTSTGPRDIGGYGLDQLGRDIHAVIDVLGANQVHLLGHSFGGVVSIEAAIQNPRPIASLTLWNSGPYRVPEAFEIGLEEFLAEGPSYLIRTRYPAAATSPTQQKFVNRLEQTEPAQLQAAMQIMATQKDRVPELRSTGVPVLVSHGDGDAAWPQELQRWMAYALSADYWIVARAGHCSHWDRPVLCADLLAAHWTAATSTAWEAGQR